MRISEYHSRLRKDMVQDDDRRLGIELEFSFNSPVSDAMKLIKQYKEMKFWFAEYDRSVDIEIISHKLSLKQLKPALIELSKFIRYLNKNEVVFGTQYSGMHINIERKKEDERQIQKHIVENKSFYQKIGGKNATQIERYSRFETGTDKFLACGVKRNRFEFRFFRSTTSIKEIFNSVLLCMEIVESNGNPNFNKFGPKFIKWIEKKSVNVVSRTLSQKEVNSYIKLLRNSKQNGLNGLLQIDVINMPDAEYRIDIVSNDFIDIKTTNKDFLLSVL
ncbi:MAG: hypothetical protein QXX30_00935 [Candidatus Aenigmatarchaeota archaeon]